ncbi:aminoglycoside phosphotransferase family protein [Lachnoclostridium phytofermentans]|uniref:Aminoglycoside phosphotransferase n=1 Tax=Lachnoclostridium phytofermentans (strain ATCC 700394 / DSM 18823 / ISDg) TaxID=357809 RepID=A9KSN6_LACP7|nr:aminoglycoside phosphotransferase family protein [Lachnoclostridium phytofermentans]ABX43688.1 aminoglycoside phosphotransferase [Lachnoclostridium phytofermentans ISDg]
MEYKMIGQGNTANVYEWEDGKVLKLFHQGYPINSVKKEYENAKRLNLMNFEKPMVYDIVAVSEQYGILYDKVNGISMFDWLMTTGDMKVCAQKIAQLQNRINENKANEFMDYKEFLQNNLQRVVLSGDMEARKQGEEMLHLLTTLKDGENLCHGDYHPGNIFIEGDKVSVIDFMNCCKGPREYDIARSLYLMQYSPIPQNMPGVEELLKAREQLADHYLNYMKVSRKELKDYLAVISVSRGGE